MSILDKFSMHGKVAVVTGGNRSIGRAIAISLAEAGASIAIAALGSGIDANYSQQRDETGI